MSFYWATIRMTASPEDSLGPILIGTIQRNRTVRNYSKMLINRSFCMSPCESFLLLFKFNSCSEGLRVFARLLMAFWSCIKWGRCLLFFDHLYTFWIHWHELSVICPLA